ncbi:MAG: FG-GAP repeat protein [Acidobacteria bacterium]|nr:FG-GAP repeat protein [Acidobacteriota bacterium]
MDIRFRIVLCFFGIMLTAWFLNQAVSSNTATPLSVATPAPVGVISSLPYHQPLVFKTDLSKPSLSLTARASTSTLVKDLTGDGKADLIQLVNGQLSIRPGGGEATFADATLLDLGHTASLLAVSDANETGKPVVLVLHTIGQLEAFQVSWTSPESRLQSDVSSVATFSTLADGRSLTVSDVNHDGYDDIVVAFDHQVMVWFGSMDGYDRSQTITLPINGLTHIDKKTGRLLAFDELTQVIHSWSWQDDEFRQGSPLPLLANRAVLTTSDLNFDGYSDVVAATDDGQLNLWLGDEVGEFTFFHQFPVVPGITRMECGHLNLDGLSDLVFETATGQLGVMWGDSTGMFNHRQFLELSEPAQDWAVGELDGDTLTDLVLNEPAALKIFVSQQKAALLVTTTDDAGPGSLREAILGATAAGGANTIAFNIPGPSSGPFVIKLATALPQIPRGTVIDGTTQVSNSKVDPNPNGPDIFIDATTTGVGIGFNLPSGQNIIRGIGIFGANGVAIQISGASATGNRVEGCYLGTNADASTVAVRGNNTGILINAGATNNTIGGASLSTRNIISGNSGSGVVLDGTATRSNLVTNNIIGLNRLATAGISNGGSGVVLQNGASTNQIGNASGATGSGNIIGKNGNHGILVTGTGTASNAIQANLIGTNQSRASLGNTGDGIRIISGATRIFIGGVAGNTGNTIAFNTGSGVKIGTDNADTNTQRNTISQNSIFGNTGLGIDLGNTGATVNDTGDVDTGPNSLVNKPVITSVIATGTNLTITGTVDTPNPRGTVELYANTLTSTNPPTTTDQRFLTLANAASTFTVTISVPSGAFAVTAIFTDDQGNSSEFADLMSVNSGVADLVAQNLVVSPASAPIGGTINVGFSIRNQGAATAGASSAAIVYSSDATIDANDQVVARVNVASLAASGTSSFPTNSVTIPAGAVVGSRFIAVIADSQNAVTEGNEANNTVSIGLNVLLPKPDLAVTNLSTSTTSGTPGSTVSVSFNAANRGSAVASTSVAQIYLSTDSTITVGDTLVGMATIQSVAPNTSLPATTTVTIPGTLTVGSYFLGVILDPNGQIDEMDETNNTASSAFSITGQPDLVVDSVTISPTSVAPGATVSINLIIRNQGPVAAGNASHDIVFSNDATIRSGEDVILVSRSVGPLPPNQTVPISVTVVIPTNQTSLGMKFIGVIADSGNAVAEVSETNNTGSTALTLIDIVAPSGSIIRPNGGEALAAGRAFETIEWTATDNLSIASQELRLSTDGGATFPTVIMTGLAPEVRTLRWDVPVGINTSAARVQIVIRDASGNEGQASSSANFTVAPPPVIVPTPKLKATGKLVFSAVGSNIVPGAKLQVTVNGAVETFDLAVSQKNVIVKNSARSTPGGRSIRQLLPKGTSATLVIQNPNNVTSTPFVFVVQ